MPKSKKVAASAVAAAVASAVLAGLVSVDAQAAGSTWKPLPQTTSPGKTVQNTSSTSKAKSTVPSPIVGKLVLKRFSNPARTSVYDSKGKWLASFTDGARTVYLSGLTRTFSESTTKSTVKHGVWVRLLPAPFTGKVDAAWLTKARADVSPDILAIAFQYTTGAKVIKDAKGNRIAGDATYGPMTDSDPKNRAEGNDWSDYLGINVRYPNGETRTAKKEKYGSLDCSGFVRMVFGRRAGYALTLTKPAGGAIPRRAVQMYENGPGVVTVKDAKKQIKDFSRLRQGDLVFFDSGQDASNDGNKVDHVGIYLGKDNKGHYRFVSSRKIVNGPTMGDVGGASLLDGTGLYATQFRAVRRL